MTKSLTLKNRVVSRTEARSLDLASRVELERQITDSFCGRTQAKPLILPAGWKFEDYVNRNPRRKKIFQFLGSLKDKTILDIGCGYHPAPIYFALVGAKRVVACDVSPAALQYIRDTAVRFGVHNRVVTEPSPVELLPFDDGEFDLIHGCATLHHLDLSLGGPQILRVLKEKGRGAFSDPLGHNPMLEFARDYLPYSWKHSAKGTDCPLKFEVIEEFGKLFSHCHYTGYGLLSLFAQSLVGQRESKFKRFTFWLDDLLLTRIPFLQRYCRSVVTCVEK